MHSESSDNAISDCPSRLSIWHFNTYCWGGIRLQYHESLQNTDEILSLCFSYVHCKTDFGVDTLQSYHRHWKHLHIVNCLLYYNDEIVVPSALHNSIMQLCRNHSTSEYFSVDRTPDQIKQSFFWPNVHNFVVQWIKSWPQCNEFTITIPKLVQTACSTSHNK